MAAASSISELEAWDLFEAAGTVAHTGLEPYLQSVLERCARWFLAVRASIFVRGAESGVFEYRAAWGIRAHHLKQACIVEGQGLAGQAIQQGQPVIVGDLPDELATRRSDVGSAMIVPLVTAQQQKIGVLNIARRSEHPEFDAQDLARAKVVGQMIAMVVGNAQLFAQASDSLRDAIAYQSALQSVIETVGFGLVVIDAGGTVTHVNAQAREFFGFQTSKSMPWQLLIASLPEPMRDALRGCIESAFLGETEAIRLSQSRHGRRWTVTPSTTHAGGVTLALHETTRDDELARLKRLAEIGQMTSAIAHEIRNPLTGILSAAQMIQVESSTAVEFGGLIEQEANKLNMLCNEFLDFAKPIQLHRSPVRLSSLVLAITKRHRPEFEAKGVELAVEVDPADVPIDIDARRIEQVLTNLVINALQATESGKRVTVTVQPHTFTVEDEGCGMAEATLSSLFTPFFTTKPSGTGLGLSTVKKILDQHGATIEVASAVGVGTRFEVKFEEEGSL